MGILGTASSRAIIRVFRSATHEAVSTIVSNRRLANMSNANHPAYVFEKIAENLADRLEQQTIPARHLVRFNPLILRVAAEKVKDQNKLAAFLAAKTRSAIIKGHYHPEWWEGDFTTGYQTNQGQVKDDPVRHEAWWEKSLRPKRIVAFKTLFSQLPEQLRLAIANKLGLANLKELDDSTTLLSKIEK